MLMLRKKGTTEPVWPFHELLAARADIESFDDGRAEPSVTHVVDVARVGDPPADVHKGPMIEMVDVTAITDKKELRALCDEHGIKVAGNPSVFTLHKVLQDHFAKVAVNARQ